ncbi:MAG: VOC family protein [Ferruginibacter sp.]|nr:VOC family protein [Ferruginibacter sp.]
MITNIHPKLPMVDKEFTRNFYCNQLGFHEFGISNYDGYLMMEKDSIQIHFFEFKDLNPNENYGQVYIRIDNIDEYYQSLLDNETRIHPNGKLGKRPWGQNEFSLLDPNGNLLTFGESI